MRAAITGAGQILGWTALLFVLAGCPEDLPIGDDDDDTEEQEGGSGVGGAGGAGGASGQGGAAGTGGAPGAGGSSGDGGEGGDGGDQGGVGGDGGGGGEGDQDGGAPNAPACDPECGEFQHCELVQVACIQAPCPPHPECVDNEFCGGFAGFTCDGAAMCVDDPRDECDPENGGADCGGVCVCRTIARCLEGTHWDGAACDCVSDKEGGGGDEGAPCGPNTCAAGEVCCNESCGICTAPDGACTQQFCG